MITKSVITFNNCFPFSPGVLPRLCRRSHFPDRDLSRPSKAGIRFPRLELRIGGDRDRSQGLGRHRRGREGVVRAAQRLLEVKKIEKKEEEQEEEMDSY